MNTWRSGGPVDGIDDIRLDGGPALTRKDARDVTLSEYEFRLIRDHIHDYCGIFFDDSKASTLASRLSFRLKLLDIGSYLEYYNYLKYNPRSKEEMEDLIPHLTNNETYFFREMNQISYFMSVLMEEIKQRKQKEGSKTIRILSCGCSSGEEAFTLAMLFEEKGIYAPDWDIRITGIDIDRKVLEKAASGLYTSYSLRATDKAWIDRHFKKEGELYRVERRIRDRVKFVRGNLMDPLTLRGHRGADAIFCRNVLIYFSDGAIKRIAEGFHDTLSDSGCLMLGHSESLSRITDIFYARRNPNTIIYTKKDS